MTIPIDHPRVHGYDRTIVIVRGDALPSELLPARLPREADRHTVIVAADPPVELAALIELLARHLPVRCESIRLVLSDAGQPGVAQVIADQLRIEVLAPTGPVMLLRTGMLFVVDGTWWCFRPGEPAQREGARHPAPDWQRLLPPTPRPAPSGLRVTAIPAGLWVHQAEPSTPDLTATVLSVFVDPEQSTVVIGRPGTPALPPEPVYDLLESLPRQLRRRLILVPYGAESATADTVGEWLAARTGGTVEVLSGVADTDSDGATVRTTVDASGEPGWRPFAQRLVYRAGATPQVTEWRRPLPDVPGTGGSSGSTNAGRSRWSAVASGCARSHRIRNRTWSGACRSTPTTRCWCSVPPWWRRRRRRGRRSTRWCGPCRRPSPVRCDWW